MRKRIQLIRTIFIILLFVGTLTYFGSNFKPSEGTSEEMVANDEFDNTISEPSGKSLEMLGQYDENLGMPHSMYIEGDNLYISGGDLGIAKISISDPVHPNILGNYRNESQHYGGLEFCVQDNIAYFADFYFLRVVDVTDINNAVELTRISDDGLLTNVKAYDDLLIVNDFYGFIRFYNISDPANLILINSLNLTHLDYRPHDYDYIDDTLYILGNQNDNSSLVIYDVTDFNSPVYVGNYTTPYESSGLKLVVDGSIAYIMNQKDLEVVNITIPTAPSLILNQTLTNNYNNLQDLMLIDDTLYILNYTTLVTFDVSNSSEITIVDIDFGQTYYRDFVFKDDYLYLSNPIFYRLEIYEILIQTNPQRSSTFYFGGFSNEICVENEIAYVANDRNGTLILDVSDATNPRLIGSYFDGDRFDIVEVSGSILYALSYQKCLKLIDISDPSNPILLSEYQSDTVTASYFNLEIVKDKVIIAQGFGGLEIIDVSDSSNPKLLGAYTDQYIYDIELMNDYIIANSFNGINDFIIFKAKDPTNIQLVSSLNLEEFWVSEITVEGNRAYLLCNNLGSGENIQIVSITDPKNPKVIESTRIDIGSIITMEARGDFLYLGSNEGLIVLRNSFDRLTYVGRSAVSNIYGVGITIDDGYIFMASGYEGLTIFKAFPSVSITTIIIISVVVVVVVIFAVLITIIIKQKRR